MPSAAVQRRLSLERRSVARRGGDLGARIKIGCLPWMECRVRNISPMGALLDFGQATVVPRQFRLQIPSDLFETECDLRHQSDGEIGVLFLTNRAGAMAKYS